MTLSSGIIKLVPDPKMNFSNFVVGNSNSMARAMALYVSENPAGSYNPCYIYGGRGTGKSHLVNAIANELIKKGINVLIGRISGRVDKQEESMRHFDAIVIDDFVFGAGNMEAIFVDFVKGGGQLVLTGSLSPDLLPASPLAELMRGEGKSADIPVPEEELKVAILKTRADEEKMSLPDDVAHFIAGHMGGNIASLVGALKRVRAHASLEGREMNRFTAIESLKDYIWTEEK